MTIGQLCFYDQVKGLLLGTPYFTDNLVTHFTSSLCAGAIATTMTQPLDVLKTRAMNAKPGEFSGALDLVRYTGRNGPMAFYKVNTASIPNIFSTLKYIFRATFRPLCDWDPRPSSPSCSSSSSE